MTTTISRLTTDYVDTEDRVRLSGAIANGPPVAMWLTQRLALRLLPELLKWLDGNTGAAAGQNPAASRSAARELQKQVVHCFAQEAALSELTPQPPVQAAASDRWLIQ
jgi:hypothetical protein